MHFFFYRIFCKNAEITDSYIGHATDIRVRMTLHKYSSNKPDFGKTKLCKIIRENGGWENWDYEILCEYDYPSEREALVKEQELFDEYKPSLNTTRAIRLPKDHPITIAKAREGVRKHREKVRQAKESKIKLTIDQYSEGQKEPKIKLTPEQYSERQKESKKKWYDKVKLKKLEDIAVETLLNLSKTEVY
jgi:hypothetical protein